MFGYETVINFYKTTFALMHHHKYSLTELENMIPWEKYVYIDLLTEFLKKQEQDKRDKEASMKARRK